METEDGQKQGLKRVFGHRAGVESVRQATEFAAEKGIRFLSLFAFSDENWKEPQDEVNTLMELIVDAILKETPTLLKNNVKFRVIGDKERLPEVVQEKFSLRKIPQKPQRAPLLLFFSVIAENGIYFRQPTDIIKEKSLSLQMPSPDEFDKYLSTAGIPDPDLLIRTSGEQRISNYLLWQTAYTEFYFQKCFGRFSQK